MTYKILEALTPYELENMVNKQLMSGWKLSGGITICSYIGNNKVITHYAQSMYNDNMSKNIQNEEDRRKELKNQFKKFNG